MSRWRIRKLKSKNRTSRVNKANRSKIKRKIGNRHRRKRGRRKRDGGCIMGDKNINSRSKAEAVIARRGRAETRTRARGAGDGEPTHSPSVTWRLELKCPTPGAAPNSGLQRVKVSGNPAINTAARRWCGGREGGEARRARKKNRQREEGGT